MISLPGFDRQNSYLRMLDLLEIITLAITEYIQSVHYNYKITVGEIIHLKPFIQNTIKIFVGNKRFINAFNHNITTKYAFTGN